GPTDSPPPTPGSLPPPPPGVTTMSPAQIADAVRTLPPDGQAALAAAAERSGQPGSATAKTQPPSTPSGAADGVEGAKSPMSAAATSGQAEGQAQGAPGASDIGQTSSQTQGQLAQMARQSPSGSSDEAAATRAGVGFDTPVAPTQELGGLDKG